MEVRKATISDSHDIAKIHVDTWQHAYKGQMPDSYLEGLSVEDREEKWKKKISEFDNIIYVVADEGGVVKGFVTGGKSRDDDAADSDGELYAIYIDSTAMGRGLGSVLEKQIIKSLKEKGYTSATLWVLKSNQQARKFYEARGWKEDGKEKTDQREGFELHEVRYRKAIG